MHRNLHLYLAKAHGESRHVIAISIDIRGFSKFCKSTDSADVALFISKFYLILIEKFKTIDPEVFYKPTGDGLMVCISYDESNLQERFQKVMQSSMECVNEFESLFDNLSVINFETPKALGIGIARGSASAVLAEDGEDQLVIDYSGHKLNFAARLQDLARPSGIVFEKTSNFELLSPEVQEQFSDTEIYVRSVAEDKPVTVSFTTDLTKINPQNLEPLSAKWGTTSVTYTKSSLLRTNANISVAKLSEVKKSVHHVRVFVAKPHATIPDMESSRDLVENDDFTLEKVGKSHEVHINLDVFKSDYPDFIEECKARQAITFTIQYHYD